MVLITIVNQVYKPTYNWGGPHCTGYINGGNLCPPWTDPSGSMRWHEWGDTQAIAMRLAGEPWLYPWFYRLYKWWRSQFGYFCLMFLDNLNNRGTHSLPPGMWPKTSCWLNLMVPKKWKYLWLEGRLRGVVFFPNHWSPHLKVMLHPLQMLKLYPVLEALLQD